MTAIMIFNVKTKYTAVGRKEMVIFFYLYMIVVLLDMLLVTGIIPAASVVYPVRIVWEQWTNFGSSLSRRSADSWLLHSGAYY